MNLKLLKLLNGEIILGDISFPNDDEYLVRNPIAVALMPDPQNPRQPRIGLMPWIEFSKDKVVTLQKAHVLYCVEPLPDFKREYEAVISNLLLPQKPSLILPS